jgi:hypothetical protein
MTTGARLMPTSPASNVQPRWERCYQDGLLSLYQPVHQFFAIQPTRLFLRGFYIRGSMIEFWVFDRSGLYCSDLYNVYRDFIQFHSTILSYWARVPDSNRWDYVLKFKWRWARKCLEDELLKLTRRRASEVPSPYILTKNESVESKYCAG